MTVTQELPTGPPRDEPPLPPPPPGPPGEEPPGSGEPPPLRRSSTKRLVGGVCGGIAERLEVDVTVVRIAFVVAACLWGIGVVVYLALWALLPAPSGDGSPADPEVGGEAGRLPWMSYLLLTAALFLGLMLASAWFGGPRWGGGLGLGWLVVLFAVVVVALRRPTRRPTLGRVLLTLALIVVSLVILATGAFFGAVAMTGVPMTGGIGQRVVQPITPTQLAPTYRLAVGSLTVDLTHVPLGSTPRTVAASVAVGRLVIDVPRGAVVNVDAHTGIGSVTYGSSGPGAFSVPETAFGPARPQLIVDAQVGLGQVELLRGGA